MALTFNNVYGSNPLSITTASNNSLWNKFTGLGKPDYSYNVNYGNLMNAIQGNSNISGDTLKFLQNNPNALKWGVETGQFNVDGSGVSINPDLFKDGKFEAGFNSAISNGTWRPDTNNSLFGWGTDMQDNTTFGGGTGLDWLKGGIGAATSLYGLYQGNKQLKLARDNFEEQKALSRANYQNQAKAFNNSLRNQQSGRSFSGMSGSAKRTLGREYDERKANEKYW